MAEFKEAYLKTAGNEGGYSNTLNDNGGETYKGISRRSWPGWLGWKIIDGLKGIERLPPSVNCSTELERLVKKFYKTNFYDALNLDDVDSQPLANEIYDTAVNMGVKTAAVFVQRVLNAANKNGSIYTDLRVDGIIGKVTISAINKHPYPDVIRKGINCLQGAKYIDIAEKNKSQESFINGWFLKRV